MTKPELVSAEGAAGGAGVALKIGLWLAQVFVSAMFCFSAYLKLGTPPAELVKMGMVWPSQVPPGFLMFIGLVDLAGGLGILLPALTRIQPRLTVLAALGCSVLQVLAIGFHALRGEFQVLPLNFILLSLSLFVLWGRGKRAPIAPR